LKSLTHLATWSAGAGTIANEGPAFEGIHEAYMQVNSCQVCQSQIGTPHLVREFILGSGREFLYWECSDCKCLSLVNVPDDIDEYHAQSYLGRPVLNSSRAGRLLRRLQLSRLGGFYKSKRRSDLDIFRQVPLTKRTKLLEIGGGPQSLAEDLQRLGYNARGIDAMTTGQNESLGEFDLILFRHSLGHLPIETLRLARSHVNGNGWCVVRMPILGWAWRNYGTDWAHLDAPRNRFLHTRKSFQTLVEKSGFLIQRVVFESDESQFWASEARQRRIRPSEAEAPTPKQLKRMRRFANDLNQQEQGDKARFYLRPA
jgi:hypothetical protein